MILIWTPICLNTWQMPSFIGQNSELLICWLIDEWVATSWLDDNSYLLVCLNTWQMPCVFWFYSNSSTVYTILVWNTISGSSNLDICCYHCLILTLIFHLKVLINFFFFFFIIIIIIIITTIIVVVIVLLLIIIYTINLPVVRPRSCRVIYYFDTPALGRRHQSFGRVKFLCD